MGTKLFLSALAALVLLAGAPLYALEEVIISGQETEKKAETPAPPPAGAAADPGARPAYAPKYLDETLRTISYLSAMLERQEKLDPKKLKKTAGEITGLNKRLKELLGPGIISELEAAEEKQRDKALAASAKLSLASVRSALQIYYGDHNGDFPKTLEALVPDRLKQLPELQVPGHEKTGRVTVLDTKRYDSDLGAAITDSGGWLYFSSPDSLNFGMLVIDCSHKEPGRDFEWYKY